jgi:hypothetical protein
MNSLLSDLDRLIDSECGAADNGHCHSVSLEDIKKAVVHLKHGKHDGSTGHYTDHLIHGTERLHTYLALLFSSMLHHSYAPESFMLSTVVPIPKNKRKSLCDSGNYRGIALSSVLGKVLDWVILIQNEDIFSTSDQQFGFKAAHSTSMCTYVVKETIHYYTTNGSNVHTVLLDATKAFDRVQYIKLFRLLLAKGLCPTIAKFLVVMYTNQGIRIKWNGFCSRSFSVSNGVKQGGVLSPILFVVYIDQLLRRLSESGFGCHIGTTFVGALSYADDLVLLCPTVTSLKRMLDICSRFADEYDVKFNPKKSKHIYFANGESFDVDIIFNNECIEEVSEESHLGFPIGNCANDSAIKQCIYGMYNRTNSIMADFRNSYSYLRYELFRYYCMSALWLSVMGFLTQICQSILYCVAQVYPTNLGFAGPNTL